MQFERQENNDKILQSIFESGWIQLLLLLSFFPPAYLTQNALLDQLFDAMKLMAFLLVCVQYFADIRKHMQNSFNILLLLLWAEMLVSTLLSEDASLHVYLVAAIPVFGPCFMVEEIALHNSMKGLKSMYLYFSACVLINTATFFLYPNAMYANNRNLWVCWFLGEDNAGYAYYIIASTISMLYCRYISKRITAVSLMVWLCSFISVFYRDIATGIVCQLLWAVLVICSCMKWFKRLLRPRLAFYITTGGFFLLVISRKLLLDSVTTVLHRNVTLSGRTVLWDIVWKRVLIKPFLGYGICDGYTFDRFARNNGLLHAHNCLLMLAFYGGLTAALLFCLLFLFACRKDRTRPYTDFDWCIAIGLIMISVRFLVEAGNLQLFYPLLALSAYSMEFESNISTEGVPICAVKFRLRRIPRIQLSFTRR